MRRPALLSGSDIPIRDAGLWHPTGPHSDKTGGERHVSLLAAVEAFLVPGAIAGAVGIAVRPPSVPHM
jgi:hypothetical protein